VLVLVILNVDVKHFLT